MKGTRETFFTGTKTGWFSFVSFRNPVGEITTHRIVMRLLFSLRELYRHLTDIQRDPFQSADSRGIEKIEHTSCTYCG